MSQLILSEDFSQLRGLIPTGTKTLVLYDRNVSQWVHQAADPSWELIALEGGEALKQWERVEQTVSRMMELLADRSWFLVGMGGGTVCDFAGFIGSVYMRGMPFGLVPTTLLAQVDAALGGKNGIHFGPYKNIIGCTQLPRWVFCNPAVLRTLPRDEFRCGLAECIKHGAIASESYFRFIEEEVAPYGDFSALPAAITERLIAGSQQIKMKVVEEDLYEKGVRKALNFGHTFGHALAACYPEISHGQAVAKGMALAAACSAERGLLQPQQAQRLIRVLNACGLDPGLPCPTGQIIPHMLHDKKKRGRDLDLVLLKAIGEYVLVSDPVELWMNRAQNPGVSLDSAQSKEMSEWLDKAPWVELRLDLAGDLSPVGMVALRMQCMGKEKKLMLTHPAAAESGVIPDMLAEMVSWGAGWVDIPLDAPQGYAGQLTALARTNDVQVIRSAHFPENSLEEIPGEALLEGLAHKAFSGGADFLKIAVHTRTPQESDALLAWCDVQNRKENARFRTTMMIMGPDALRSRKHALRNGYPFVYAAPSGDRTTAPGQPAFQEF
ncbi:MAG TPA: type I 3-dehydroquinate dehydratase [Bacteroidales bacterium]|nr:MAG: 3-dehydroquinate synthase [Bacteroidetes bacterium ADurb.Bin139]HOG25074.1 type I 3-dehydroquinate dehydratase [Bacteroidales bacterium]HOR11881.1 type I 3-dehydroquinate dehydratase [Bacteroidales bacterium]HPB77438.1 type I 3-dehydroquinate dehydratase [Bacteroidales bacterium]HPK38650.1 type I 3-dehydroquinate dehydratase [Bacteroidales bacterium]